jgi:glucokinase
LGLPLYLANDCTAAVWGEREFGAGRGVANLVYITLSTGIGGGAIVDGHLLLGKDGNAVEIGHVTLDFAGIRCGCGKPGHWEAYCSASNIPRFVRLWLQARRRGVRESLLFKLTGGKLSRLTTQLLFEAAQAGDKLSCEIVQELGLLNAIGFANVINAYDPELITVGGAMALNNPQLILDPIRRYVRGYVINRTPRIRITPLGHDITLYGATALVFNPPPGLTRW